VVYSRRFPCRCTGCRAFGNGNQDESCLLTAQITGLYHENRVFHKKTYSLDETIAKRIKDKTDRVTKVKEKAQMLLQPLAGAAQPPTGAAQPPTGAAQPPTTQTQTQTPPTQAHLQLSGANERAASVVTDLVRDGIVTGVNAESLYQRLDREQINEEIPLSDQGFVSYHDMECELEMQDENSFNEVTF